MTQHPDNRHSDIPRSSGFFIFFCCLSGTCSLFLLALRVLSFFFYTFCTCQVGHLFSSILTSHISNFSSKFWSCRWQTLQIRCWRHCYKQPDLIQPGHPLATKHREMANRGLESHEGNSPCFHYRP